MPIKFIRQYGIYNPGDVVAFNEPQARQLVEAGVANFWTPVERPAVHSKMVRK